MIYHNNWHFFPFITGYINRGDFYNHWHFRFDKIWHIMHIPGYTDHFRKVVFTYICVLMIKHWLWGELLECSLCFSTNVLELVLHWMYYILVSQFIKRIYFINVEDSTLKHEHIVDPQYIYLFSSFSFLSLKVNL